MRKAVYSMLLATSMLVVGGRSDAQTIKVFTLTPPDVVLVGVKRLAVLDLEGSSGDVFSNALIEQLMQATRGLRAVKTGPFGLGEKEGRTLQDGARTNAFELVERSRLQDVLREQRLGQNGIVDSAQAAQVGRLLGVDAVLAGTLSDTSADKSWRGTRTVEQNGQRFQVPVNCVTREVKAVARVRVTHAETGRILATTEKAAGKKDEECEPSLDRLASSGDLLGPVLGEIASALADYIAPHFELQEFDLKKVKGKDVEDLAKKAGDEAKELQVDDAFAIYKSLYDKDTYSPELAYNLGVLHEVVGNQSEAREYYGVACQLKEAKDCRKALERTARAASFQEALSSLGVQIAKHEFPTSEEALASATARSLEIRGKREERTSVFAEPREGSDVVAAVPGGVTFVIIAEEGEWYRIKLLGGKEGYVHRDKVKVKD
jgi:hypothetical protein